MFQLDFKELLSQINELNVSPFRAEFNRLLTKLVFSSDAQQYGIRVWVLENQSPPKLKEASYGTYKEAFY